ncbi:unnamed protein product [Phaeothamnion confervicola]
MAATTGGRTSATVPPLSPAAASSLVMQVGAAAATVAAMGTTPAARAMGVVTRNARDRDLPRNITGNDGGADLQLAVVINRRSRVFLWGIDGPAWTIFENRRDEPRETDDPGGGSALKRDRAEGDGARAASAGAGAGAAPSAATTAVPSAADAAAAAGRAKRRYSLEARNCLRMEVSVYCAGLLRSGDRDLDGKHLLVDVSLSDMADHGQESGAAREAGYALGRAVARKNSHYSGQFAPASFKQPSSSQLRPMAAWGSEAAQRSCNPHRRRAWLLD